MKLTEVIQSTAMPHKFKVGEIVLHKDGQGECEVLELIKPESEIDLKNPSYKLKDSSDHTFKECESYLMGQDE